jgi:beta-glucosidase
MPWLEQTAAVIEAWYPGVRGAEAIASILFGQSDPTGHLPISFPNSLEQLPRPALDGALLEPSFLGRAPYAGAKLTVDYTVEGSDVGYRWFDRRQLVPLFPFGFGLSYTSFAFDDITVSGLTGNVTATNTGKRDGAAVAQLYLVSINGHRKQRLVAFDRVMLRPGERRQVSLSIDPRLLADWRRDKWVIEPGEYTFALGEDASRLGRPITVRVRARHWKD